MTLKQKTAAAMSFLPVGSILGYAGSIPTNIEALGWLPCDGRSLSSSDYKELYEAIKGAYGAADAANFNVPALAGMFLRGVAHGTSTDPSANAREALRTGGATGDVVGSMQSYGTAQPKEKIRATIPNYKVSEKGYDKGTAGRPAAWNSNKTTVDAGGGDLETRPINKYVNYIIKIRERTANGQSVQIPVGSIISFAAGTAPDPARWALCDGKAVPPNGEWAALHTAIGYAHGETNEGEMVLPDYRGYFLRGVSGTSGEDPDADSRGVPYPQGSPDKQGNSGNKIGSQQGFATGVPTSAAFQVTFTSLPKDRAGNDGIAGAIRYLVHGFGAKTVSLSQQGGDSETRPVNLSIAWCIRAR